MIMHETIKHPVHKIINNKAFSVIIRENFDFWERTDANSPFSERASWALARNSE